MASLQEGHRQMDTRQAEQYTDRHADMDGEDSGTDTSQVHGVMMPVQRPVDQPPVRLMAGRELGLARP